MAEILAPLKILFEGQGTIRNYVSPSAAATSNSLGGNTALLGNAVSLYYGHLAIVDQNQGVALPSALYEVVGTVAISSGWSAALDTLTLIVNSHTVTFSTPANAAAVLTAINGTSGIGLTASWGGPSGKQLVLTSTSAIVNGAGTSNSVFGLTASVTTSTNPRDVILFDSANVVGNPSLLVGDGSTTYISGVKHRVWLLNSATNPVTSSTTATASIYAEDSNTVGVLPTGFARAGKFVAFDSTSGRVLVDMLA